MSEDDLAAIRESRAFTMLTRRHRERSLWMFAAIAGIEDEPARAWFECNECGAMFEFCGRGEWSMSEESALQLIRERCGARETGSEAAVVDHGFKGSGGRRGGVAIGG